MVLRAKMLALVQQILSFSAVDVLEPNWKKFEERISGVGTVDDLLRDHVDFLDTVLKGCMLTNPMLLKVCLPLSSSLSASHRRRTTGTDILEAGCNMLNLRTILNTVYDECYTSCDTA